MSNTPSKGFAVTAHQSGESMTLQSFHLDEQQARQASRQRVDTRALCVVPAQVTFASNGNVRQWAAC